MSRDEKVGDQEREREEERLEKSLCGGVGVKDVKDTSGGKWNSTFECNERSASRGANVRRIVDESLERVALVQRIWRGMEKRMRIGLDNGYPFKWMKNGRKRKAFV